MSTRMRLRGGGLALLVVGVALAGGSWIWLRAAEGSPRPPEAVRRAVEKVAPGGQVVDIDEDEEDGERSYDVDLRRADGGGKVSVQVTEDGQVLEVDEELGVGAVPEKVLRAVRKAFPKAQVKELRRRTETRVTYRLEVEVGDKRREMRVSSRGRILEIERR